MISSSSGHCSTSGRNEAGGKSRIQRSRTQEQVATEVKADVAEHQRKDAVAAATILDEVRALRAEVAELRARS